MTINNLYIVAIMISIAATSVISNANAGEIGRSVIKNEISDKVITDAIVAQYMVNKNAKGLNISVIAQKGFVTINGRAPNESVKQELEEIAKNTNGVREVISNLVVNTPQENNLIITNKIKNNLLNEKTIKSLSIRVETDDGVVTLTGEVPNNKSRDLIETIVMNTEGVKEVNSQLEINQNLEVR
jgi:hyperosmotically inducible protein